MRIEVMASTSITLGEHWELFIKSEVASGRYASASEVVRDALRSLEERKVKLDALRAHLSEGALQASRGEFADDYSLQNVIRSLDHES
jgi:antitoxin ParD1/3/4